MDNTWTIYTDGGSRGNPGPAAYAYVIKRPGLPDIEGKCYLGKTTNNIAEYTGVVKALEHAKEIGGRKLILLSDSELMVKQMNGQYKVKNEGLRPLYLQAVALRKHFDSLTIKHIYRDQNSQADALCNEAMDDRSPTEPIRLDDSVLEQPRIPAVEDKKPDTPPAPAPSDMTPLMQALAFLKQSAVRWARGDANDPPPADVLNRIAEILQRDEPPAAD
ncbi:MAG: ribonuclease HI family protein [Planctomycetes bacterium]|nr:ribonuclease HI family protein [Planctomycetota bacterium]